MGHGAWGMERRAEGGGRITNYKFQIPNSKFQITNWKFEGSSGFINST
jgi:hypothetical protein